MSYKHKFDLYHSEAPHHLGYHVAELAGLDDVKCWTFEFTLDERYRRHPHFGDNPEKYFDRVIETYKEYKNNPRDIKAFRLLNGYTDRYRKFHHGLLGKDLMFFLSHGYFPIGSKYIKK